MVPTRLTHQPPPSRNGKIDMKEILWAHGQYQSDTKIEEKVKGDSQGLTRQAELSYSGPYDFPSSEIHAKVMCCRLTTS